jgi:hypothetical protein
LRQRFGVHINHRITGDAEMSTTAVEAELMPEASLINVPIFTGSGFQLAGAPTEIMLLVTKMVPATAPDGGTGAVNVASVGISLSPHALKELAVLLTETVQKIESEQGVLNTPFLSERAAGKPAS